MTQKKRLGQFFTDPQIAQFMLDISMPLPDKIDILDPALGEGIFISTIINNSINANIECFEVDSAIIKDFEEKSFAKKKNINIYNEDYLYHSFNKRFDFIICNPPYNKFQEVKDRKQLIRLFKEKYNFIASGYSNYYTYFLIKSLQELKKNGKCVYIIPYEFLNCGYGKNIKEYIINTHMLKKIIKFDNNLELFDDAMTTSCILLFENTYQENIEFISIDDINGLSNSNKNLNSINIFNYDNLVPAEKWSNYFKDNNKLCNYKNLCKVSEILKVKRGIATGNNTYFTLNKSKIKKYKLSQDVCVKCICKSQDIKEKKFNKNSFDLLYESDKNVYIFDGTKATTKEDFDYIKYGETKKVDKSYLTCHRKLWYSIENRESAPIWITVFNRGQIKLVRNEENIKNLTTFHGIYPNDDMSTNEINILYCYLITPIAQELLLKNKREYAKGLNKFEPNDLNDAYMLNLNVICAKDKKQILNIYNSSLEEQKEQLNNIFEKYII